MMLIYYYTERPIVILYHQNLPRTILVVTLLIINILISSARMVRRIFEKWISLGDIILFLENTGNHHANETLNLTIKEKELI